MVRSVRRPSAARWLAAGAVLLVACGGSGEASEPSPSPTASASPTPSPTPAPSPSPTAIDVAAVPAEIDVAYVQAVLDELHGIQSRAFQEAAAAGELTESFHAALRATHTARDASRQIDAFERFVGVEGLADQPGELVTEVQQLLSASPDCIEVEAFHDVTPVLSPEIDIGAEQPYEVKLVRQEPTELNPTAWAIDYISWFHIDEPCDG